MKKNLYIGAGIERIDVADRVTGTARFASDLKVAGMRYGGILYTAHPRARILSIGLESAKAVRGVKRIITADDIPGKNAFGYGIHHRPLLVRVGDETRFVGDAIALVVADTPESVKESLKAISVEYDVLRPVITIAQSRVEKVYRIHNDKRKDMFQSEENENNLCYHTSLNHGDISLGFQRSDVVVDGVYRMAHQEHAYLETEAGVAYVDAQGRLHILSAIQDPPALLQDISYALGISKHKIHIKGIAAGGAFGGKLHNTIQVHLAAMAYLTGEPVKLVLDRYESFIAHPKRHAQEIRIKIGSSHEGAIQAIEAEVLADAGPYSSRSPDVLGLTVSSIVGPYNIPNVHVVGKAFYTNNVDADAFRGFGAPQAGLAREGILDKLARSLELDPVELRRRNFLKRSDKIIVPLRGDSPVSLEVLAERVLEKMGPLPESCHGKSIVVGRGICFDMPVFDVSSVPVMGKSGVGIAVEMLSDATVIVFAGGCELGQGITTVLAQITAEELGLSLEQVTVEMSDSWTCPSAGKTSASRLTYVLGNSLLEAAGKLKRTLLERAAQALEIDKKDLILELGKISVRGSRNRFLDLREVAGLCSIEGIKLREEGWFKYPGKGPIFGHTFMVSGADVSVDMITGEVRVLQLVNVHDSGRVINPVMARGQQIGGSVQALGYVLSEDFSVEAGEVKTSSFAEYMIPTALDIPKEFTAEFVETPYPTGPYGAKGMAEHSLNTSAPAILNAICDATGCELTKIPVYAEEIIMAIREKRSHQVKGC